MKLENYWWKKLLADGTLVVEQLHNIHGNTFSILSAIDHSLDDLLGASSTALCSLGCMNSKKCELFISYERVNGKPDQLSLRNSLLGICWSLIVI